MSTTIDTRQTESASFAALVVQLNANQATYITVIDLSRATNVLYSAVLPVAGGASVSLSSWLDSALSDAGTWVAVKTYGTRTTTSAEVSAPGDYQMALLEATAEIGNIEQFTEVYNAMNLDNCAASDLVHVARLALSVGALNLAKATCEFGVQRFPEDNELNRMNRIFAPPNIKISRRPPPSGTRANTLWLKSHGDYYRGKWVALRAGELLASAKTIDELVAITGDVKGTGIFILPIH